VDKRDTVRSNNRSGSFLSVPGVEQDKVCSFFSSVSDGVWKQQAQMAMDDDVWMAVSKTANPSLGAANQSDSPIFE